MDAARVLIIDDNPGLAEVWGIILNRHGHCTEVAGSGAQALARARAQTYDIALVDIHLPDVRGTDLLPELKRLCPEIDCVMMTAHSSLESAIEAVNRGAYAYLTKPVDSVDLIATVERVLERQRLREQNRRMIAEVQGMNRMLKALVDSVDSGIILVGPDVKVRFANRRAAELLDCGTDPLAERDLHAFLREKVAPRVGDPEAFVQALDTGGQSEDGIEEMEWEVLRPQRRVLRRYCVPVEGGDGAFLGRVEIYSDITRQREELEHEHHIAETLQRSILPDIPPVVQGLEVATLYRAALDEARIGGDFYDAFPIDRRRVAIVIGDVSGKGLDAAMQTAMIRYALRSYAFEDPTPALVLRRLNRLVYAQGSLESFTTLFYALLDLEQRQFAYVNAGHEVPFLWVPQADDMLPLRVGGPVVGAMPGAEYAQEGVPWPADGTLLLYTDGLSEARRDREFLDPKGVRSLIRTHAMADSAREVVDGIYRDLLCYVGNRMHDDVALLAIRFPR